MSTGDTQVNSPSLTPATTTPQPSNAIFKENVSMLYTPTTPVKNYPMEIDGATPRKIEDMETDEPAVVTPSKIQSNADAFINEDFFHATVSKIFGVSLKSEKNCITLSSISPNHPLLQASNYMDNSQILQIISDLIMEAFDLIMYAVEKPTQLFLEGSQVHCLQYLFDCYSRMEQHEKKYSKRCSIAAVKELLAKIKSGMCAALALLLEGYLTEPIKKNYYEILYDQLKSHSLPCEFFYEFVNYLESDAVRFNKIFSPLLLAVRKESQKGSVSDSSHRAALQVLSDLCECRTGASSSTRPFCNLMIKLGNWIVEPLTEATGREFAKFTYLGPFLCTSLFAEDDPRMSDKLKATAGETARPIVTSLQQEIELTRNLLHKVGTL